MDKNSKEKIYNLIIVDESGSMSTLAGATKTGVNETIQSIRKAQEEFAETQEHFLTLVTFDSRYHGDSVRTLIDGKPIGEVKDFTAYHPNGGTPLYDAMGQSLTKLYERIKDDDHASAVVTVLTDGEENSSTEWRGSALKALIEKLTAEGWSFSYMGSAHDVTQVAFNLSIQNVVEFSHDAIGASNTWERDRSAKMDYFRKMDCEQRHRSGSKQDWISLKRQLARDYYGNRVTPDFVDMLAENEVFVFGSNPEGVHTGGAAALALNLFGAVTGQGEGLQGRSYAIPSTGGMNEMQEAVQRFTAYAARHPELHFLVTRVGCGNGGKRVEDVAQMFRGCISLENVSLPREFWDALGLKMNR